MSKYTAILGRKRCQ